MTSISVGPILVECFGLEDDTPFMTIRESCDLCAGAMIAETRLDVRDYPAGGPLNIGDLLGNKHGQVGLEHLESVHNIRKAK